MTNIKSKYDYSHIGIILNENPIRKKKSKIKTCKKKRCISKGTKKKLRTYKIIKFSSLLKK